MPVVRPRRSATVVHCCSRCAEEGCRRGGALQYVRLSRRFVGRGPPSGGARMASGTLVPEPSPRLMRPASPAQRPPRARPTPPPRMCASAPAPGRAGGDAPAPRRLPPQSRRRATPAARVPEAGSRVSRRSGWSGPPRSVGARAAAGPAPPPPVSGVDPVAAAAPPRGHLAAPATRASGDHRRRGWYGRPRAEAGSALAGRESRTECGRCTSAGVARHPLPWTWPSYSTSPEPVTAWDSCCALSAGRGAGGRLRRKKRAAELDRKVPRVRSVTADRRTATQPFHRSPR